MKKQLLRGVGVVAAVLAIGACKAKETSDTAMVNAVDSTKMGNDSMANMNKPAALTDANIVAILDAANAGDSAAGAVAAKKGTNAAVRKFGADMVRDHHQLRKMGQDLAKKLNVTPEPPANMPAMQAHQDSVMATLNSTAKGAAFDKWYIDNEVATHQSVLSTLNTAQGAAQNSELKDLITKAIPVIQNHLKMAQDAQGKLK